MKAQLHGLRHGQRIDGLVVDTRSSDYVIIKTEEGGPVARQAKNPRGRAYRQGTNPDPRGYETYPLEYYKNGRWLTYDSQAHRGDIINMLGRLRQAAGVQ